MKWRSLLIAGWWLLGAVALRSLYGAAENSGDLSGDYLVKTWRTEHGLPENSITAVAQSSDGYLWLGTRSGLARMDGVACAVFTRTGGAGVSAISAGASGKVYVAWNDGALVEYTGGANELLLSDPKVATILCILPQKNGSLLLGGDQGLAFWSPQTALATVAERETIGMVRSFSHHGSNTVWVASSKGLWRYERGELTPAAPRGVEIRNVAVAPHGGVWMAGAEVGLMHVTEQGGTPRRVWPVSAVQTFLLSRSDEVWFAGPKGRLERILPGGGSGGVFETGAESINHIFEDREGSLWLATEGAGALQIRRKTINAIRSHSGGHQLAQAVCESASGQIYLAGRNGQMFTVTNGFAEVVSIGTNLLAESMLATREGGVWIATRFDGLFYWPNGTAAPQRRSATIGINALYEDRAGRLWVGSARDGVLLFERGSWRVIAAPNGGPFEGVCSFSDDAQGGVWIAAAQGQLAQWKDGSVQWVALGGSVRDINCAYNDIEGNLWIGTHTGLLRRRDGRTTVITAENGLPNGDIRQIQEDARGNLWFCSGRGIYRANKHDLVECGEGRLRSVQIMEIGREEGLGAVRGIGGNQPSSWRGSDGKLWFSTQDGVVVVDPLRVAALEGPISALLEEVRVDNKLLLAPEVNGTYLIPAGYQHLTIRYTAPTFITPEQTQFRFRMNGLEQEWISDQQHRTASYGRLPAGEYRFEVVARNRDGTWPAGGTSTLLQIAPRYWETNWFRGLGAALAGVLVVLFWVQRLARRRALNALREQITRDLHDDLGSNLGSIALLSEALRRSSGRSNHEELLQEINRIARETLDSMRDMLWFVDPGRDDLADLVERLRQLTETLLKGVAHEFHASAKFGAIPIALPLKRAAVLIFKEALHNVIRHAHASRVDVSIKVEGSFFSFEIVDNGLGFDVEIGRDGHGLNNMKHRAQSIGGTLRLQTKPGEGTRLVFEVKLVDAG